MPFNTEAACGCLSEKSFELKKKMYSSVTRDIFQGRRAHLSLVAADGTAPVNRHFHHPRKFYGTELIRGNAFQAEGKGPGKDTPHRAAGGCNTHRTAGLTHCEVTDGSQTVGIGIWLWRP